jgi:hypothetical protein
MGVCHSENSRKKNKNNEKDKNGNNNENPENNEDTTKLRSARGGINQLNDEYNITIINSLKKKEIKCTVKNNHTLIQILKNTVNYNPKSDFTIEFENNKTIDTNKIDEEFGYIIKEIFGKDIPEIINMKYIYKGLDIPENQIQAYKDNNKIIGNAILDNSELLGIITYEICSQKISSYKYKASDYPNINTFNNFTAYCNAKNCLYFSGGENEQTNDLDKTSVKYNDFCFIDLTTLTNDKLNINDLPSLNEPRTWHSMIFVPNKYIFIVGGSNTKSVELYDMEEKKLTKDSELNEIRCESTLCLVNNTYLYAFFGFVLHQEYNNNIERCNLLKEKRKWEYVNYQVKEGLDLKLSFFGIIYSKENELLLIGENDANNNEQRYDYSYSIESNEEGKEIIKEYDSQLNENNIVFREKFFQPIEDNKFLNIPSVIGENIRVFIFENGKFNILNNNQENK